MKRIFFTVTNDLTYDQRMQRICTSLANNGYDITLIGRQLSNSLPLDNRPYKQKRLRCFYNKGFLFYLEYNTRLCFYMLQGKMDAICAIDLDTILPCLFVTGLKNLVRIYDAHEYFTELKEVHTRPLVQKIWRAVERLAVPKFKWGYTVSSGLAEAFHNKYQRDYPVIRNLPLLNKNNENLYREKTLLYQGAVNHGRGFEWLIPAMKTVPYKLVICGDGNFMEDLKQLVMKHQVQDKVALKGMVLPGDLPSYTHNASLGIAISEKEGLNQFMALPNKFFDYMHGGLPQIAMRFPEYEKINEQFKIAVLIDNLLPENISNTINFTMQDEALLKELENNCLKAREVFCWQSEEKKLVAYYQQIFAIE
ncbi:MAG TPA: glycosyltransferase [Flavisolibacter sp.]|nr:glycosyltransferase [Flavisolibacter sp.]